MINQGLELEELDKKGSREVHCQLKKEREHEQRQEDIWYTYYGLNEQSSEMGSLIGNTERLQSKHSSS